MNDSDLKKVLAELAQAQLQSFEAISALVDLQAFIVDSLLHHPPENCPVTEATLVRALSSARGERDRIMPRAERLQSVLPSLKR
jgi:hypothetical protein